MRISVVIPTYNRCEMLHRALESIYAQTVQVDEVIVVNDGSSDDTEKQVTALSPRACYLQQENQGVSNARNRGIKAAQSEWVALLDSDDAWHPKKLEFQITYARANPNARLIHCNEQWIRNGHPLAQKRHHRKSGGDIFSRSLERCLISPSAVVLHRSLFTDYGYFDETFKACEDYDLWLRICAFETVHFVDEPLVIKYGGHSDQLSRTVWGLDRYRIKSLRNLLNNPALSCDKRRLTEKTLRNKINIFADGAEKRGHHAKAEEIRSWLNDIPIIVRKSDEQDNALRP